MSRPAVTYRGRQLRISHDTLLSLATLAVAGPDKVDSRHLSALRRAEVVSEGGEIVAEIEAVARAVAEPLCLLEVEVDSKRLHGWVSPDMVVLLEEPVGDDLGDVMVEPTTYLPLLLTNVVALGPRPVFHVGVVAELDERELFELSAATPELLLCDSDAERTEDLGVAVALASLIKSYRRRWIVRARWGDGARAGWRVVEALDSDDGWWGVERVDGRARLAATDATILYRRLTALLPTNDELGLSG